MLATLLKILSTAGIVLLCLLALLLLLGLLILFFPVTYKAHFLRNTERMEGWLKARWLFGLFRLDYVYPEPGLLRARILWLTLYDSGRERTQGKRGGGKIRDGGAADSAARADGTGEASGGINASGAASGNKSGAAGAPESNEAAGAPGNNAAACKEDIADGGDSKNHENTTKAADNTVYGRIWRWILAKYEKIKYTFQRICDKIKHILENYQYYSALLAEEDTRLLFSHAGNRLGKVWKSIRPRRLKADIHFGTGSPDTTGYLLGVYGMLSPQLGNHINVTPDFGEAVLYGEASASGRITAFVILFHGIRLLLDRRLGLFIKKWKRNG